MGVPQDPRRVGWPGSDDGAVDGVGNPEQGRNRPCAATDGSYLAAVPALPGRGDPGVRLLHSRPAGRHPGLCPGRDRARHQAHPHPRSHRPSNRAVDGPAGPEPADGPRRAGAPGQVHDPGPRLATGSRINAGGTQDLPDGGRRDRHAEFRHFAVDPAVSPQRILLRQPNDKAGDAPDRRRQAGLARLRVSYLLAASLRCQASSIAGATAKTSVQRLRGISRAAQRTTPGRPTRNAPGRRGGAAPSSRAGVPAAQHPSPGPCGTPGRPSRVSGELAGIRS